MDEVVVRVPARSEFLHLLRSVIAGMAARQDLSVDSIDDLRLAVDEAGAHLLSMPGESASLTMRVSGGDQAVTALLKVDLSVPVWPPSTSPKTMAWTILSGLMNEVSFEIDAGHPAIRLVKGESGRVDPQ